MSQSPPIIDVHGLTTGSPGALERVAAELPEACSEWGVFHVVGHEIPASRLQRFGDLTRRFFELPLEVRNRVRRTRENARGYYDEELTKNRPDWKQVFDYGAERTADEPDATHSDGVNQWLDDALLPGFRDAMLAHYEACAELGLALLRCLCASLGLHPDALDTAGMGSSSSERLSVRPATASIVRISSRNPAR